MLKFLSNYGVNRKHDHNRNAVDYEQMIPVGYGVNPGKIFEYQSCYI